MNKIPLPKSTWDNLTPELVRRIAECLHPNEVASSLKLANSDTAAALSDYRTLYLAHDGKDIYIRLKAQQPWPGHAFVAHWGRPEPWRELSLRQRERLLCLAASSGHAASLDAALHFSGCALKPSVLTAAAVGGDELASKRLLAEGCSLDEGVFRAAARGGHLRLIQLLLNTTVSNYLWTPCLAAAAQGACAGGQLAILTWLQQEHGYSLRASNVGAAAEAGHVELVERLMPLVPDCAPAQEAWKDCDPQDFQAVRDLRSSRWELLMDVVSGCPVEVLQRHHDRLWHWPRRQPVLLPGDLANPAALAAAVAAGYAGAEAAGVLAGGRADLEAVVEADVPEDEDQSCPAEDVRAYLCNLFRAAACSPTPCWAAKLSFLLSTWGPRVEATLKAGRYLDLGELFDAMATERPDYLQRLKHLADIGVALDSQAAEAAFSRCRVEALVWLVDECDALPDEVIIDYCIIMRGTATEASDCVAVLEALRQRGWVFEARYLARSPIFGWPDAALLWLAEVGEDADAESPEGATAPTAGEVRAWWSRIFTRAAQEGASLPVLQALRARGAAVDLAAVAQAGGEAALAWAAAQLLAEGAEAAAGAAGSGGGGGMTLQVSQKRLSISGCLCGCRLGWQHPAYVRACVGWVLRH